MLDTLRGGDIGQPSHHTMTSTNADEVLLQIVWLLVLALPVATASWTVTHEEIFREPREYCAGRSRVAGHMLQRKFFYVFTCEYCLSHYVAAGFIALTGYRLLLDDWRGYLLAFFATVGMANVYMGLFGLLRIGIKAERLDVAVKERAASDLHARRPGPGRS